MKEILGLKEAFNDEKKRSLSRNLYANFIHWAFLFSLLCKRKFLSLSEILMSDLYINLAPFALLIEMEGELSRVNAEERRNKNS